MIDSGEMCDITESSQNFSVIDTPMLSEMECAYQRVSLGYDEPDRVAANPSTLGIATAWLTKLYPEFIGFFHNALLTEDCTLPMGLLHFYLSTKIDMAVYHSFLYVKEWGVPMRSGRGSF